MKTRSVITADRPARGVPPPAVGLGMRVPRSPRMITTANSAELTASARNSAGKLWVAMTPPAIAAAENPRFSAQYSRPNARTRSFSGTRSATAALAAGRSPKMNGAATYWTSRYGCRHRRLT